MCWIEPPFMADVSEVVKRSMNINEKLGPRLQAAAEQNAILELVGQMQATPCQKTASLDSVLRFQTALGYEPSVCSAHGLPPLAAVVRLPFKGMPVHFWKRPTMEPTSFAERMAGHYTGYGMMAGNITVLDGTGDDTGASMSGGTVIVRGASGARIGGGMQGGLIVVHGDVGPDPGAGMSGVESSSTVDVRRHHRVSFCDRQNQQRSRKSTGCLTTRACMYPSDAVCLTAEEGLLVEHAGFAVFWRPLANRPPQRGFPPLRPYQTVDTVALLGVSEDVQSLALPLPMLPLLENGSMMVSTKVLAPEIKNVLDRHPALVAQAPRAVDVLLIGSDNLHSVPDELPAAGGMAIDLDRLPVMNAEQIDGLLVALRSLAKDNAPVVFIESISRIQSLHTKAGYHGVDLAMARIEDGSGISELLPFQ